MLFVPDHGPLHSDLCAVKEQYGYLSGRADRNARYKESHFTEYKSRRDVDIAAAWLDVFVKHSCYFRSIVVDWSIWDGRYFGNAFDPDALKKKRAYKKWAEMLLQPEIDQFRNATVYLDRLHMAYGYDVLEHLQLRFAPDQPWMAPAIRDYQTVDSWRDAHQALQLCDLLVGCIKQSLEPAGSAFKREAAAALGSKLAAVGLPDMSPNHWKGFHRNTLRQHHPKFSEWYWKPDPEEQRRRRGKRR